MLIYQQSTGLLWLDYQVLARGYSGHGDHKNDPESHHIRNQGPIPRGHWLVHQAYNSKSVGPVALVLSPEGHDALTRTYFRIHGDSISEPGTASRGCIIMPRETREIINERIKKEGAMDLHVVE